MVACGRAESDRRVELVKLFGLLRSDGIFPSAVTLGQYTRAIAEGFSKRSSDKQGLDGHSELGGVEVIASSVRDMGGVVSNGTKKIDMDVTLDSMNINLSLLESSGRRWRQRNNKDGKLENGTNPASNGQTNSSRDTDQKKSHKGWIPITCSTSFSHTIRSGSAESSIEETDLRDSDFEFVALWSRATTCDSCSYVPLDEEIQSGWDIPEGENDGSGIISCPRCGNLITPLIGYRHLSLQEAMHPDKASGREESKERYSKSGNDSVGVENSERHLTGFPPQLGPIRLDYCTGVKTGFIPYINPSALRLLMEQYVDEHGEEILERQALLRLDPILFYNFWWYCARFSLPLPLAVVQSPYDNMPNVRNDLDPSMYVQRILSRHCLAFAAWERRVAEQGCMSGATAVFSLFKYLTGLRHNNPKKNIEPSGIYDSNAMPLDDLSLLSNFSLQNYAQGDWDHPDLSEILVTLVEACDKRELSRVVDCFLRCNKRRMDSVNRQIKSSGSDVMDSSGADEEVGNPSSVSLDCYRTILYLARYQCTTAFHAFFPATMKPCKGYHFWCATSTPLPILDGLFRDAATRIRGKDSTFIPIHDISDIALGFRCVFGHII